MVNKVWFYLIFIGLIFCLLTGKTLSINKEILESGQAALEMVMKIFPVMALWLGISKIAEESGLLTKLSTKLSTVLKYLFPDIPKNHSSLSYISSNILANMFGLGNAATPFGLKAMQSLQELNKSDTASRPMITFLVLNTSGVTLIPTTVISLRMMYGSIDPTSIVLPCIVITILNTIIALLFDRLFYRWYK